VQSFRAKLRPDRWDPIYLVYPSAGHPAALENSVALWDALTAFARGRLASFGVETLLRGPALVIRLLAILLVPWTILLAVVAVQLFPSPGVRTAWVAFDAVLTLVLFALAARWRRWLGIAVATAVSLDAILTALQVLFFNLKRLSGPYEALAMALAIAAPTAAGIVVWRAVGHRHATDQTALPIEGIRQRF
jgi:phosphatidylglycerol lysyltransferase